MVCWKWNKKSRYLSTLVLILAGLLSVSCTGRMEQQLTPTEPAVSEKAVSQAQEADCRELFPAAVNPQIEDWLEPHYICAPAGEHREAAGLFLFLPGTGATPDYYRVLMETAAQAGLYVINLRYPNDSSVNLQLCPLDGDDSCHEKVRAEILLGEDLTSHVDVNPPNSITGRLRSALAYLVDVHPQEGWARFLDEKGEPLWSLMTVSGHSQGAGHAVYLAMEQRVERAVAFAWVDVRRGQLAPWLTVKESQTPPEDYYLFFHRDDDRVTRYQEMLMAALGVDRFGDPVVVDESSPPYEGSHALLATAPPPEGERAHNTHVADKALTFDQQGAPRYQETWRYLLTLESSPGVVEDQKRDGELLVNAVSIGLPAVRYIDPEFYAQEDLVAFSDGQRRAWLGELDPLTGDFVSADGKDILIDFDLTRLATSFNGPEFGLDQDGWALYYTKNFQGTPQVWRAELREGGLETAQLTADDTTRLSVLASKDPTLEETRLLYALNGFTQGVGEVAWLAESDPVGTENAVAPIDRGARWVDGTALFTYVRSTGIKESQVVLYDTESGKAMMITSSPGRKSYAYGWLAPEDEQLLVMAVVEEERIEIYRDSGGDFWEVVQELEIPEGSAYEFIGSPEPFTSGGKSYLSLVVKADRGYSLAEAWVWGIDAEDRFLLRCEDGQGEEIRSDPETYAGAEQVFLYYHVIQDGGVSLYKCATGIPTSGLEPLQHPKPD